MSSSVIPISADSTDESVGSSTFLIILSDSDSDSEATIVPVVLPIDSEAEATIVASLAGVLDLVINYDSESNPSEDPPSFDHAPVLQAIAPISPNDHL
ncbi:hypothetical protein Tco_1161896, partial [Tanacetum coccineum]